MAAESGLKVLLKVGDGGTPTEVFTVLAGQQNTTMGGSTNIADITDKSNNGWELGLATTRSGKVSCSGVAKWDAQLARLEKQWLAGDTVNCECVLNAAGDKYAGPFYVASFEISGETKDATKYSIELQPAAALTRTPSL